MSFRIKSAMFSRNAMEDILKQQTQEQQSAPLPSDPTFGVSISSLLARDDHANINPKIPHIVRYCVTALYKSSTYFRNFKQTDHQQHSNTEQGCIQMEYLGRLAITLE
jgi:hypothetical protein